MRSRSVGLVVLGLLGVGAIALLRSAPEPVPVPNAARVPVAPAEPIEATKASSEAKQPIEVASNTTLAPEPPDIFLPVPFPGRDIRLPEPGAPKPSETVAYCDDANWRNTDIIVERPAAGVFAVDESTWQRTPAGTRAGLASWMSQCHRTGAPIEIVSASTGAVLATYDVWEGLRTPFD